MTCFARRASSWMAVVVALATPAGVPPVDTSGQGGLLDVAVDPQFDPVTHPWV